MKNSENNGENETTFSRPNLVFANVVILVVFLLIVAGIYVFIVKKNKGQIVFPAGINYLSPNTQTKTAPTPMYDYAKLAETADWKTYKGKTFPYSFQHPKELTPLVFINDPNDSVTFKVSDVPPQLNLMVNVETISSRDAKYVGKPEEFVRNYWRFFSGLKGLNTFEKSTNEKGMTFYKATYVVRANNSSTADNYFFVIEGDDDHLVRVADIFPPEGKILFNRIINSFVIAK